MLNSWTKRYHEWHFVLEGSEVISDYSLLYIFYKLRSRNEVRKAFVQWWIQNGQFHLLSFAQNTRLELVKDGLLFEVGYYALNYYSIPYAKFGIATSERTKYETFRKHRAVKGTMNETLIFLKIVHLAFSKLILENWYWSKNLWNAFWWRMLHCRISFNVIFIPKSNSWDEFKFKEKKIAWI